MGERAVREAPAVARCSKTLVLPQPLPPPPCGLAPPGKSGSRRKCGVTFATVPADASAPTRQHVDPRIWRPLSPWVVRWDTYMIMITRLGGEVSALQGILPNFCPRESYTRLGWGQFPAKVATALSRVQGSSERGTEEPGLWVLQSLFPTSISRTSVPAPRAFRTGMGLSDSVDARGPRPIDTWVSLGDERFTRKWGLPVKLLPQTLDREPLRKLRI